MLLWERRLGVAIETSGDDPEDGEQEAPTQAGLRDTGLRPVPEPGGLPPPHTRVLRNSVQSSLNVSVLMAKGAPQRQGGTQGKAGKQRVVNHVAPHSQVGCFRNYPQQHVGSCTTLSKQLLLRGMLLHSKTQSPPSLTAPLALLLGTPTRHRHLSLGAMPCQGHSDTVAVTPCHPSSPRTEARAPHTAFPIATWTQRHLHGGCPAKSSLKPPLPADLGSQPVGRDRPAHMPEGPCYLRWDPHCYPTGPFTVTRDKKAGARPSEGMQVGV